jgi:flagellar biosynthetic protein FlhB
MSDQRTEQPTQRRIGEARSRGESVGRSHELSMALTLGAAVLALSSFLPGIAAAVAATMKTTILDAGDGGLSNAFITTRLADGIRQGLTSALPISFVVMVSAVIANVASGGWILSGGALRFKGSRLNPIAGLKRLVDRQAFVRLAMASIKLAILGGVTYGVLSPRVPHILASTGGGLGDIAGTALSAVFDLGLSLSFLLLAVGLADFVIQRRRAQNALKMTKQEIRQEGKDQEGNPQVRSAMRRRARQMAMQRMMAAVPTADVVVVNPIRLAIALKYEPAKMAAPTIVAKGQRLMAARIRDLAREHNVPIVEDVPLARVLITRPLGSQVPAHLYRAIARILVLVQSARFGRRAVNTSPAPAAPGASGAAGSVSPAATEWPFAGRPGTIDPSMFDEPQAGADR